MPPAKPHPESPPPQSVSLIGRDEMNLAEFPIALLADRVPKGQKTLYFEDKHGRLTVTGSDAYGLPTATDSDVIVALLYLTKIRTGFANVKVNFSRYELIKLLNWRDETDSYKRLSLSFKRWGGVWLVYDKCWWNNRLKCYTDSSMHIIDTVEIIDNGARRKAHLVGQGGLPLSYFTWNSTFIESCQADNLRQLDLDTYFSLGSAVSKRLYRFLGKRFYLQGDWTFDLNEIAFDRVGLSRNYTDAGKIKEKLQPAIDELEAIGFLRLLSRDERYKRIDRGQWTIRLIRQPPALVSLPEPTPESKVIEPPAAGQVAPAATPGLTQQLIDRGVTASNAVNLVKEHEPEVIGRQIEAFDWRVEKKHKHVQENPAGFLVRAIQNDYAMPKGFISQAERQRREEVKRQAEQKAAEDRRRQQEEEARQKAEQEEANAYWAKLTPQQQAQLDAEVLAKASKEQRQTYETLKRLRGGDGYLKMLRVEYIHALLHQQTELA